MQILALKKQHIDDIVSLASEFEDYIQSLSNVSREPFDTGAKKFQLLQYGFWKQKAFSGYVAKVDNQIVGYALYHYGFDPDDMQGKVIHLIDFFVRENTRGKWVGRALIEKLQSHPDSIGLYFWVWKKNLKAIEFYKKMWADWIDDVPFMKLMK